MKLPMVTTLRLSLPDWVSPFCDASRSFLNDEQKMRFAIALSSENIRQKTGGPFGAAVFRTVDNALVAVGVNSVAPLCNSALHAEMFALMLAERSINSFTFRADGASHYELFTSCVPCAMCLGGILWSGVQRVVTGATRDDAMRIGFDEGPVFPDSYRYLTDRGVVFTHGVLSQEARAVLDSYQQGSGLIYNG